MAYIQELLGINRSSNSLVHQELLQLRGRSFNIYNNED
jgi:hypothetical protein